MAVFKCKMCGGALEIREDITVAECEYCGTTQTVPTADNEKKISLFTRANKLRAACEFDKAAGVYESIVAEFIEEAEAYWGLILCNYGIEYVDDPKTGKKIPTCHRSSFDSVLDSENFEMVMENADAVSRKVYREEAKTIEELRKSIIEVSSKEEPYDIFICYKETDENGDRTIDSVIAQDVYTELTDKGYRVFFSRITLEDKLGQEYEPYIFAALNSAKVMLAFGTDYEYYNAVWVKNEWSRFLQLIAKGEKKTLIPCYKNIDAYDMPKEFARLQAQDMGKVGAVQDLLRGIEKIIPKNEPSQVVEKVTVTQSGGANVEALLKRGNMALEDKEWHTAKEYFDQVLNMDAECAEAYLGFAMIEEKVNTIRDLVFENKLDNKFYVRAKRYADDLLLNQIISYEKEYEDKMIKEAEESRINEKKLENIREKLKSVQNLVYAGDFGFAFGLRTDGTIITAGEDTDGLKVVSEWKDIVSVSVFYHIVGLKYDGTVVAAGKNKYGECDVSGWKDITTISSGVRHTVGLKKDGTVVATGENKDGQCEVSRWNGIIDIASGFSHTVGLKSDGTVIAAGENKLGQCDVSGWKNIIKIFAESTHTVGISSDGTVFIAGKEVDNEDSVLAEKHEIYSVSSDEFYKVGLNSDGTVKVLWDPCRMVYDTSNWNDILFLSAGLYHIVGLRVDGSVVATGKNQYGQCDVSEWKDIVAVSAGDYITLGLKADGTIVAAGEKLNISDWKLFDDFENIKEERMFKIEMNRKIEEQRITEEKRISEEKAVRRSQSLCQHCGGSFKGLFKKYALTAAKKRIIDTRREKSWLYSNAKCVAVHLK